jgi:hypothetical protein
MFHLQKAAGLFIFGRVTSDKRKRNFSHGRHFFAGLDE